jgi:hypothetical protein
MRRIFILAAAAAALIGGYGSASAQSVGVEVYSGPQYGTYYYDGRYDTRPGPRVYGYYQDDADEVVVAPRAEPRIVVRPGNCGQFRYWNGTSCADARVSPPKLN